MLHVSRTIYLHEPRVKYNTFSVKKRFYDYATPRLQSTRAMSYLIPQNPKPRGGVGSTNPSRTRQDKSQSMVSPNLLTPGGLTHPQLGSIDWSPAGPCPSTVLTAAATEGTITVHARACAHENEPSPSLSLSLNWIGFGWSQPRYHVEVRAFGCS